MRSTVPLLAVLLIPVALGCSAFGGEAELAESAGGRDPRKVALPSNPFPSAAEGDWCVYAGTSRNRTPADKKWNEKDEFLHHVVTNAGDEEVVVFEEGQAYAPTPLFPGAVDMGEGTHLAAFASKGELTLGALMVGNGFRVRDVKTADATRTIGGRAFECKKVSFTVSSPRRNAPTAVTAWLSSSVKVSGLVAWSYATEFQGTKWEEDHEIAGFGAKGKTEWGKAPRDVCPSFFKEPHRAAGRFPVNPFATAQKGDWSVYAAVSSGCVTTSDGVEHRDEARTWALVHAVRSVDDQDVLLVEANTVPVGEPSYAIFRNRAFDCRDARDKPNVTVSRHAPSLDATPIGSLWGDDVRIEDDMRVVGGEPVACKKVTRVLPCENPWSGSARPHLASDGTSFGPFVVPGSPVKTERKRVLTLWLSSAIKGSGIVALTDARSWRAADSSAEWKLTIDLVGHGNGTKPAWGKLPKDVDSKLASD